MGRSHINRTDIAQWDLRGVWLPSCPVRDLTSLSARRYLIVGEVCTFEHHGKQYLSFELNRNVLEIVQEEKQLTFNVYLHDHDLQDNLWMTLANTRHGKPISLRMNPLDEGYYESTFDIPPRGRYKILFGFSKM